MRRRKFGLEIDSEKMHCVSLMSCLHFVLLQQLHRLKKLQKMSLIGAKMQERLDFSALRTSIVLARDLMLGELLDTEELCTAHAVEDVRLSHLLRSI